MNYVLAIVIFTTIIHNFGYRSTILTEVVPSSPAQEAGILPGDRILEVNNLTAFSFENIQAGIALSYGNPINMTIDRNGEKKEVTVTPRKSEEGQLLIGVSFPSVQNPSIGESFKQSFNKTASLVSQTFKGLEMIFTGKANLKTDVGGPITIVKMSAATAQSGIWDLANFVGFLSVNLAVFNLLPFPALDGGWCVILLIELITRRKVPDKIVGVLNYIGFAALIALMIMVTVKDILFPVNF
jgi:regulator of sigma E protease